MRAAGIAAVFGPAVLALVLAPAAAEAQVNPPPASSPAPTESADLKTGPATIPPHWSKYRYPESIPEGATYYVIVRGDTLWDISRRFMGSPYLWPQVWDQNRYITDAHWIYPGDPLVIPRVQLVGDAGTIPSGEPMDAGAPAAAIVEEDPTYPVIEEVALQCAPYVVDEREDESLMIIGSEQGATKVAFADRDILYLNKGENAGIKPNDVYTIHHPTYQVRHPDNNKRIGQKVETTGWLRVILVQESSATAVVEQACSDIHAGDYLKPFEAVNPPRVARRPPSDRLTPPTGGANGAIVDIRDDQMIAGEGTIVVLNLGTTHGIAPGNVLAVYRIMYPSVPTSRNVLGEVTIVSVRERTSVARVTYSRDAMMSGDRVELR